MSDVYGFAAAVAEMESEVGSVFAWNGIEYPCVVGARQDGAELGIGGFATAAGLEVVVRTALFTEATAPINPPTATDTIHINGKSQKIVTVTTSPDGSVVVLACEDANQDA